MQYLIYDSFVKPKASSHAHIGVLVHNIFIVLFFNYCALQQVLTHFRYSLIMRTQIKYSF